MEACISESLWKLPRNSFAEAAINGNNGSFHFHRRWERPCTFMEVSAHFHGSKSTSMNFHGIFHGGNSTSIKSMEVRGNFNGSRSNARRWILMEVLWNQLEVCSTRGSRCKYVGVHGSSWQLPRNKFMEATIDVSSGSFQFHRPWKLPYISMEASINFHGSKPKSTDFHGNVHGR